ncbi:MAG: ferrochelatase, partial [Burkholderiaceae bacterium]|nr:ferrochelatase [Burkholderiaceae bacterium]
AFLHAGGTTFNYIPCLNDSPLWAKGLTAIAASHLSGWPTQAQPNAGEQAASQERALAMGAKQ